MLKAIREWLRGTYALIQLAKFGSDHWIAPSVNHEEGYR